MKSHSEWAAWYAANYVAPASVWNKPIEGLFVIFDGNWGPDRVVDYAIMPSGDIVVLAVSDNEGIESFWFDKDGKHPKSHLSFVPKPKT